MCILYLYAIFRFLNTYFNFPKISFLYGIEQYILEKIIPDQHFHDLYSSYSVDHFPFGSITILLGHSLFTNVSTNNLILTNTVVVPDHVSFWNQSVIKDPSPKAIFPPPPFPLWIVCWCQNCWNDLMCSESVILEL